MDSETDAATTYDKLVQGLERDDLTGVDLQGITGGDSALIEIVTDKSLSENLSIDTWSVLFDALSSGSRKQLLLRLGAEDRWSDALVRATIDSSWVSGEVDSLFVVHLLGSDRVKRSTTVDFFEHIDGFDKDTWRYIDRALQEYEVASDEFIALYRTIGEPAEGLKRLIENDALSLIEPYMDEFEEEIEGESPSFWFGATRCSVEGAEALMALFDFPSDDMSDYLLSAIENGKSSTQPVMVAYARQYDPDKQTLNDMLHGLFYHSFGRVNRTYVDQLLEAGAEPTEHEHYGQFLVEESAIDNDCGQRFREWLKNGELNTDTIRIAFQDGSPEVVAALQDQRNLEQSVVHSALQGLFVLSKHQEDVSREIGVLQMLDDEHLQSPSGEPSYFNELLSQIAENPGANYEPFGRVLYERGAGPGRSEGEIEAFYDNVLDVLEQDRAYEQWLTDLAGELMDEGAKPLSHQVKPLRNATRYFKRLIDEKLNRREKSAADLRKVD